MQKRNLFESLVGLDLNNLNPIDRARVVKMRVAAALTSLSKESLRREYREHVLKLSEKRDGMPLGVVADIATGKLQPQIESRRRRGLSAAALDIGNTPAK